MSRQLIHYALVQHPFLTRQVQCMQINRITGQDSWSCCLLYGMRLWRKRFLLDYNIYGHPHQEEFEYLRFQRQFSSKKLLHFRKIIALLCHVNVKPEDYQQVPVLSDLLGHGIALKRKTRILRFQSANLSNIFIAYLKSFFD